MASGPTTAAQQVKNRMTPATVPCSDLGKQLMPLELIVGYRTDIKRPDNGSRYAAVCTPLIMLRVKQIKMAKLNMLVTAAQFSRASIHEPINLPAARSTKKMEMA